MRLSTIAVTLFALPVLMLMREALSQEVEVPLEKSKSAMDQVIRGEADRNELSIIRAVAEAERDIDSRLYEKQDNEMYKGLKHKMRCATIALQKLNHLSRVAGEMESSYDRSILERAVRLSAEQPMIAVKKIMSCVDLLNMREQAKSKERSLGYLGRMLFGIGNEERMYVDKKVVAFLEAYPSFDGRLDGDTWKAINEKLPNDFVASASDWYERYLSELSKRFTAYMSLVISTCVASVCLLAIIIRKVRWKRQIHHHKTGA